jgi:hypothetical protein
MITITALTEMIIIWLPALVSILGIVGTVLGSIAKTKSAIAELKDSTELKNATLEMKRLSTENQELIRTQKLLLEEITRIQNYADEVKKK